MNPYLEPQGFLGTGASLLADVTLVAYLLIIVPAMFAGYYFAKRKLHRPHHKYLMILITIVNWVLILALMVVAYSFDVIHNIGQQPGNARYLVPTIHGVLGLAAQLLATYAVYRMIREDTQVAAAKRRGEKNLSQYWFKSAKPTMRLILVLWLATSLLGVFNYLFRYNVIPNVRASIEPAVPAATPEVIAPPATEEATAPPQTEEATAPVQTEEATPPAATEEVTETTAIQVIEPAATEEASATATRRPTATRRAPAATVRPSITPDPREMLPPAMTPEVGAPTPTPTMMTVG